MTHGDIKSVQGDTGHAEAEMVTDVYSEIVDEDRRLNAKKLDEEFYDTLDTEEPEHNLHSEAQEPISDNDKLLLELLKSMTPEMKEKLLKKPFLTVSKGLCSKQKKPANQKVLANIVKIHEIIIYLK